MYRIFSNRVHKKCLTLTYIDCNQHSNCDHGKCSFNIETHTSKISQNANQEMQGLGLVFGILRYSNMRMTMKRLSVDTTLFPLKFAPL